MALTTGLMGVSATHDDMLMLATRAEVPWTRRVGTALSLTTQVAGGSFGLRDGLLSVPIRWVDRPSFNLRTHVGANLPLGAISNTAPFRMISTGSVDPWLSVDALYGAAWLGLLSAQVRTPLVEGRDGVRQGVYWRLDARVARRLGSSTTWLGTSVVDVGESTAREPCGPSEMCWNPQGYGAFREVAVVGGATIPLTPTFSFAAHVRVPAWMVVEGHRYRFSGGVAGNVVLGKPKGMKGDD